MGDTLTGGGARGALIGVTARGHVDMGNGAGTRW